MAEVTLTINGKNYGISCDDGQEGRVKKLGQYIDRRIKDVAGAGAANNELHLLVLTSLILADEIFELRHEAARLREAAETPPERDALSIDEATVIRAIESVADRIEDITERVGRA